MGRDTRGRFTPGNQYARQGWTGLVQRRFGGDERACKAWWGAMGAWHSDAVYRAHGLGHMPWPGTPEEFVTSRRDYLRSALEFTLADVPVMEVQP
jgi:hypothetical protein